MMFFVDVRTFLFFFSFFFASSKVEKIKYRYLEVGIYLSSDRCSISESPTLHM